MNAFSPNPQLELQKPILNGTICAAKYSVDGKWYRAKVLSSLGGGKIQVSFIDYGNTAVINIDDPKTLRKLPANLLQYEPCAVTCKLAYIKVPRLSKFQGPEANAYLRKYGLDKVHDAIVVEEQTNVLKVILVEEGEPDWSTSINAFMLADGLALIDEDAMDHSSTPEDVLAWQEYSDEASDKLKGLWKNEGQAVVSDDSDSL